MTGWNYADIWERVAQLIPDQRAQVHGDQTVTWTEFDRRADGLAATFLAAGADRQDKIAIYLYNSPEYLQTMFGAFKASLVPVNTNYRYSDDELVYLWDNSDSIGVVFHGSFTETIERIRDKVGVRIWLWVDDGSGPCPHWAAPFETAATSADTRTVAPWKRDGDDLNFMYTGGTTGMPKGVMWRQDDLIRATVTATNPAFEGEADVSLLDELVTGPGICQVAACPLMHGTGQFTALIFLCLGGSVVTLESRTLDIQEMFDTIEREKVNSAAIVGDAFSKPMLAALDAEPGRWDLSSLVVVTSSGVMWSEEVKQRLLAHNPGMMLVDVFGSSEAIGLGQSVSSAGGTSGTAQFSLGQNARVINDDGVDVEPGSGERGRIAVRGHTPIGYYKDEEKSRATFIQIDGETYSMPGDWATVESDGSLTLLGRGSQCINTGGEKVFPEEVEEALKRHETVHDAVVVGLPDDKWGQSINAVVELWPDATFDPDTLVSHVKDTLAAFKAPKRVVAIDTIGRAPNGKVDYKRMTEYAARELGVTLPA
jgi:fatty-acyl-CoA synthase